MKYRKNTIFTDTWFLPGKQLKQVRKELGMTQEQLAARSGSHQHVIARIENDTTGSVRLSTLKKMAKGLGCQLSVTFVPVALVEEDMKAWSRRLAEKLVKISSGNMAMELQSPGQKVRAREIERLQQEILKKHRSAFWASGRNENA
ncbi:MAG: helix-turn-helix domain-containing protein [Candidatus Omnitrophica bacterium]|nr:helix-turn-helix domain-containing protein [Candidatus Omnitrophota bacterium]